MAQIKKLMSGKFKTTVYDNYGKRHRKTFKKKQEADAYVSKLENLKNDQRLSSLNLKKPLIFIKDALDNFALSKTDLRPKTRQKYSNFIKQIKSFCDALSITYVHEFTPDHATTLYNELVKEKLDPKGNTEKIVRPQPRTVNFYIRTTRSFFQSEVLKGHLDKNPMIAIKNLRVEKKPPEYYSKEEIQRFFAQEMKTEYRNAFLVLLHTGMRFAELANLTWNSIDMKKKLIHVKPQDEFKTKTYNSIRSIPMNGVVCKIFRSLTNADKKCDFPICSVEGKKLRERLLYYKCGKIGSKAKIKGQISLHKFRHTFASHLVQNRVPIEVVQKLLGHSSINETMIYAHLRSEDMHADVNILDSLFN